MRIDGRAPDSIAEIGRALQTDCMAQEEMRDGRVVMKEWWGTDV